MKTESTALQLLETPGALAVPVKAAEGYARASKADATWRAYRSDWQDFAAWCAEHDAQPMPAGPDTVAAYLADIAGRRKVSTVQRRVSAISQAHQAAGFDSPTKSPAVRLTLKGIKRTHAPTQRVRKATPALIETVRKMVADLDDAELIDVRDRALLLMGFAGAFRRSELAGLDVEDVTETDDGLRVVVRRSKTDQEGEGFVKGLPYGSDPRTCPVRAWRAWRAASGITDGQAFRSITRHGRIGLSISDKAIALIVKRQALAAGLDPQTFSGHSLRAGFATAAARAGVSERAIMKQTGHKSLPVLRGYIHDGGLFNDNAASSVGL